MHACGGADSFTILVVGNTTVAAGIMQRLSSAGLGHPLHRLDAKTLLFRSSEAKAQWLS
jgi:hypothetical protein